MTGQEEATLAIGTLVSCFGLWWLFTLYRDYRVDRFREEMFALRGHLFDEAANGLIDFGHPAYKTLRNTMNGFIRFGHRLSLLEFVLTPITVDVEDGFVQEWQKSSSGLSPEVRSKLERFRDKMNFIAIKHISLNSTLVIATMIFPVILWLFARRVLEPLVQKLKPAVNRIDTAALVHGRA